MTPAFCRVKHDPNNGTYGDCVRACIASIMDMDTDNVPHFLHDDCDGLTANARIRDWLSGHKLAPFIVSYPGHLTLDEILALQGEVNRDVHYILFVGIEGGGDHVVVCHNGKVVHDPAWYASPIAGPSSDGIWSLMVLARI